MDLLDDSISLIDSYELEKRYPGFKIPMVSNSMLHAMIGNENRKEYASYFLAHFLNRNYEEVYRTLELVRTENDNDVGSEREKRVYFICKLGNEYVLLEINNKSSRYASERDLAYTGKVYRKNSVDGEDYNYNKTIAININNFNFKGNEKAVQRFVFAEADKNDEIYTDRIQVYDVYLPLIKRKYYNKEELSKFEEILLIFNENDKDLLNELSEYDSIMKEYIKDAIDASRDGEWAALEYDKELYDMMIQDNMINEAKEIGKKMGIDERNLEIANNMLKDGMDKNIISKYTGLSLEKIGKLNS